MFLELGKETIIEFYGYKEKLEYEVRGAWGWDTEKGGEIQFSFIICLCYTLLVNVYIAYYPYRWP
jgi:hypothetical protein